MFVTRDKRNQEVTPPSAKGRNNPVCSIVDSAAEAESREQRALCISSVRPARPAAPDNVLYFSPLRPTVQISEFQIPHAWEPV